MFSIETYRKETAVILKRIDQLPQNLATVHNLVGSFDTNFTFLYSSYCFHRFLLFVNFPPFVPNLTLP